MLSDWPILSSYDSCRGQRSRLPPYIYLISNTPFRWHLSSHDCYTLTLPSVYPRTLWVLANHHIHQHPLWCRTHHDDTQPTVLHLIASSYEPAAGHVSLLTRHCLYVIDQAVHRPLCPLCTHPPPSLFAGGVLYCSTDIRISPRCYCLRRRRRPAVVVLPPSLPHVIPRASS